MLNLSSKIWERVKNVFIWAIVILVVSFIASYVVYISERDLPESGLKNFEALYWWWLQTITGIGSSVEPVTFLGKAVTVFLIFAGFVLLGLFISETAEIIRMFYLRKAQGNIRVKFNNHIVILGYTSLTAAVIKLLRNHFGAGVKIVLISNDVETNPFPGQADFIHDNPISYETLRDANVGNAIAAIILANDRFRDPDTYSLVIASGIEKENNKVTTIVELVDDETKPLFRKTSIDAFIKRKELLSDLLDREAKPKLLRIIMKESELESRNEASDESDLI